MVYKKLKCSKCRILRNHLCHAMVYLGTAEWCSSGVNFTSLIKLCNMVGEIECKV